MNTLFDKIWDAHVVTTVEDGPTQLYIDRLYCHEVTSPQAFAGLRERGIGVLRPEKVFCMPDHNTPTHDQDKEIEDPISKTQVDTLTQNAKDFGLTHYGMMHPKNGIIHVVGPERGLTLPLMLFRLRKETRFLEKSKMDVSACYRSLDKAALLISQGRYPVAIGLLSQIENDIKTAKSALSVEMKRLRESDMKIQGKRKSGGYTAEETLSISLPKELVSKLQMNNYVGYLYFEYLDKGNEALFIRSSTLREPKEPFKIVSRIRTDNTGEWKRAKVELYKDNIVNGFNMPTFYLKGNVVIRNLSLGYNIYTVK